MVLNNIFVDTSWFKAISDPTDDFHKLARDQFKKINKKNLELITTNFVLDESFTLIRVKVDLKSSLDFREMLVDFDKLMKIVRVLPQDEKDAWSWFPKNWSKLSFTDCTSFAIMKRLGLKDVLTFDKHFSRAGFDIFS